MHLTQPEQQKERMWSYLRDLYDNIKQIKICIIRLPEGEDREKGAEKLFEEISKNIPRLMEESNQVQ